MDKTDFLLLEILSRDALAPFSKIAKELGISTDTAWRRYNALKERGTIKRSMVVLDICKCGYEGYIGLLVKIASGENQDILFAKLSSLKNVALIVKTLGDYDFFMQVLIKNYTDITELHKAISEIKGITSLELLVYTQFSNYPDSTTIQSGMRSVLEQYKENMEKEKQ